jgi:two-component system, NarL family, response regulator EvgA
MHLGIRSRHARSELSTIGQSGTIIETVDSEMKYVPPGRKNSQQQGSGCSMQADNVKNQATASSKNADGGRVYRVFAADDEQALLTLLADTFEKFPGFKFVGAAQTLEDTLDRLKITPVDLLILDICFNRPVSGLDLIPSLKEMQPEMKILVVTGQGEKCQGESFRRKANGFLVKPWEQGKLAEAAVAVLAGRLFYDDGLFDAPSGLSLPASLTCEDREYIEARLRGKSDAQIAKERNVKMETISQRRYRITQRLGLETDIESFLFGQLRG